VTPFHTNPQPDSVLYPKVSADGVVKGWATHIIGCILRPRQTLMRDSLLMKMTVTITITILSYSNPCLAKENIVESRKAIIDTAYMFSDVDHIEFRFTPPYFPITPTADPYADTMRISCFYTVKAPTQSELGALSRIVEKSIHPRNYNTDQRTVTNVDANIIVIITHYKSPPSQLYFKFDGKGGQYGTLDGNAAVAAPQLSGDFHQWIFSNSDVRANAGEEAHNCWKPPTMKLDIERQ